MESNPRAQGVLPITPETIEGYFTEYGWSFERLGQGIWRTGFRGESGAFTIYVRLTNTWLYLGIAPFVTKPKRECLMNVWEALLRINREMNLAKFAIDEDDDVTLMVELPMSSVSYTVFAEGLTALAYYADDVYSELSELTQNPKAQSQFMRGRSGKAMLA